MTAAAEDPRRWSILWIVAIGELLAMAPWFSASAVARPLNISWRLDAFGLPGLAIAVQVGFAAGALVLAATAAADRVPARLLFVAGATLAAVANLGFAFVAVDAASAFPFRVLTGLALAGVYPVGLRLVVGWFSQQRGTAIGIVVGALTVGSALPYFVRALGIGQDDWRTTVASASVLGLVGGLVVLVAGAPGPWDRPAPKFSIDVVRSAFREPAVRLANVGYLGQCGSSTPCGRGSRCSSPRASPRPAPLTRYWPVPQHLPSSPAAASAASSPGFCQIASVERRQRSPPWRRLA